MKAAKIVKPRALAATKTQGPQNGDMVDRNYTTVGSFADSDLSKAIPLFIGRVPKIAIKDGITD